MNLAYISQGKLYVKLRTEPSRLIESPFAQEAQSRALEIHQRREWKTQGRGGRFMSGGALWGTDNFDPRAMRVEFGAVSRGPRPGEILTVLNTDHVGGLFLHDLNSGRETRLLHKERFLVRDLRRHPDLPLTACSISAPNGTARIALLTDETFELTEVTEGDSVDEAPAWVPHCRQTLVFQSAGVGRDAQGYPARLGPYALHRLDVDTGRLETLVEDPAWDFLFPHMDAAGALTFLRRPYEEGSSYSPFRFFGDVVLFPFRMGRALFHFFNVFSLMFSKKPLTRAGGPKAEDDALGKILLRGRWIDAQKALRDVPRSGAPGALVPRSWELVRRSAAGEETVLARRVIAYDIAADGTIVFSTGGALYSMTQGGAPELLERGKVIVQVAVVDH